jgi:iduronate 2-sulfatase
VDIQLQPENTLPDIQSMLEAQKHLLEHKIDLDPFFLAVGFHKPHVPFKFPSKFLDLYKSEDFGYPRDQYRPFEVPDVAFNPYNDLRNREDVSDLNVDFPFGPIPSNFTEKIRQHYYAAVSYVDELIGQLLKNTDSKTIVILTSDHGFQLGEHAEWEKYSNYETAVKVPLIIYDPYSSMTRSKKIDSIVELIDLFPTIIDLVGLPKIEKCYEKFTQLKTCTEGKSLVPLMRKNIKDFEEVAYSQYPRPSQFPSKSPNSDKPKLHQIKIMGYSIRTQQFRYNIWIGFNSKSFKRGIIF